MGRIRILQLLIGLWCLGAFAPAIVAQPPTQPTKNVLILSAEQDHIPSINLINRGLKESLAEIKDIRLHFFPEFLDASRIKTETYEKEFLALLQQKYKDKKIDLIFTYGNASLAFITKNEPVLFSETPRVYVNSDQRELVGVNLGTQTVGATGKIEIGPTMELMLAQNPYAKKVALIFGMAPFDRLWRERAAPDLDPYLKRVEIVYLDPTSIEGLQQQISALPAETVILFVSLMADKAGNTYTTPEAVALVAATAQHPVYALSDASIGTGAVGGMMLSYRAIGNNSGELGRQILEGKRPDELTARTVSAVPMFDWRQLQKWGIDENRLPAGSIVEFRVPSVWELYRGYIAAAIAIILIQAVSIGALLLAQSRRRKAEVERNSFQALAAMEHKRLEDIVGNVPGAVWESAIDPETGHRKLTFISDYIETMLGYTVEEWLENDRLGFPIMHEDDREMVAREINSVADSGQPKAIEFRWYAKDRSVRWVELTVVAICDAEGKVIGFRGVNIDITKRKEAEGIIRESEERFRHIANTAPVMIWMADDQANVTFVDQSWADFTGFTEEQLLGDGWLDSVHPDDVQPSVNVFMPAFELREPFAYECRLRRADGEYRWMYSSAVPRYAANGDFLGYIGSDVDITEARLAHEAVKESGELFRIMANSAPVLIWMSDVDPVVSFVNKGCVDFTGLSEEELLGEGWLEIIHEEDRQHVMDVYSAGYTSREPFIYEYRVRAAAGDWRWLYSNCAPRFAADGQFLGFIGSCVDITDRKTSEQALQTALTEINQLKTALQEENIYLKEMIKLEHQFDEIIGNSDELKYVLFKIEQVAPTDATVLISGETGTGKELVARAVHGMSGRKNRPLVKVNCAALSSGLIESELFGHERGAFTGATVKKIGRFELADGGTIFLDEIGELPLELQPKLLRLIQEGEFERLGSAKTVKADVRIIAATNRDLHNEVKKGTFREDLLYRLNVFPITVPPLRDRGADIPLLVEHFTGVFSKKMGKTITAISPAVMRSLTGYQWPGNVRELANVVERAVIGTNESTLRVLEQFEMKPLSEVPNGALESLENVERSHIMKTLISTKWRIEGSNGAASILGVNPSTLRSRMQKLGISKAASQTVH